MLSTVELVLPVYNEAHVIEDSVGHVLDFVESNAGYRWKVVVVDNASTDATFAVAERLSKEFGPVHLRSIAQKGRGRAIKSTWGASEADFSIYMDIDLSTDLSAIPVAINQLEDGADIVVGSRFHEESHVKRSLKREMISRAYGRIARTVLGTKEIVDAQCGFKGVRVSSVRQILHLVENDNWFFDTELLFLASLAKFDVRHIPVRWTEDPDSRVRLIPTIWEDLKGLFRLRRSAKLLRAKVETLLKSHQ